MLPLGVFSLNSGFHPTPTALPYPGPAPPRLALGREEFMEPLRNHPQQLDGVAALQVRIQSLNGVTLMDGAWRYVHYFSSYQPTNLLSYQPTLLSSYQATKLPTYSPTNLPTNSPTNLSTYSPNYLPTYQPTS